VDSPSNVNTLRLRLSQELLDDIELSRLPGDSFMLKASRLARLMQAEAIEQWLLFELQGYPNPWTTSSRNWMVTTGRMPADKDRGFFLPFAALEMQIEQNKQQVKQLQIPNINFAPSSSNPSEYVTGWAGTGLTAVTAPIKTIVDRIDSLSQVTVQEVEIRSRIVALVHDFVSRTYYELLFASLQETLFEKQRTLIDKRLSESCADVIKKVPAIYDRLLTGEDQEAISHALTSCRRMIDAFADAVYPAQDTLIRLGDKSFQVGQMQHQNRILAFLHDHCDSKSRRERIRRSLTDLYDRLSAGVHSDVSASEARVLFFLTYILLGEILELRDADEAKTATMSSG
jgi:hypothetical protein